MNRVMVSTFQINLCAQYSYKTTIIKLISHSALVPAEFLAHLSIWSITTCLFTFTMLFICKLVSNVMMLLTVKWTHLISLACLITMGTSECSRALNNQRLMKTNVQTQVGRIAFWACVIGHAWEGGTRSLWFIVWRCPRTTAVCCPSVP